MGVNLVLCLGDLEWVQSVSVSSVVAFFIIGIRRVRDVRVKLFGLFQQWAGLRLLVERDSSREEVWPCHVYRFSLWE